MYSSNLIQKICDDSDVGAIDELGKHDRVSYYFLDTTLCRRNENVKIYQH